MIEETHHFVLSRFERTRNSLERILTINYFFSIILIILDNVLGERGCIAPSL